MSQQFFSYVKIQTTPSPLKFTHSFLKTMPPNALFRSHNINFNSISYKYKCPSIDDICYVLFVDILYAILQYDSYKYNIKKPNARLFITFLERYGSNISLKTKIE